MDRLKVNLTTHFEMVSKGNLKMTKKFSVNRWRWPCDFQKSADGQQETPELVPDGETPQNVAIVVFDDLVNQATGWVEGQWTHQPVNLWSQGFSWME